MAKITNEDILRLARLSKLSLSEEEVAKYRSELSDILGYIENLSNIDTADLLPTAQVTGLQNVLRPDELIDYQAKPKALMRNAPEQKDGQFKVKRILR